MCVTKTHDWSERRIPVGQGLTVVNLSTGVQRKRFNQKNETRLKRYQYLKISFDWSPKQREQHQSSITENVNYQLAITVGIWRFDVLASYGL